MQKAYLQKNNSGTIKSIAERIEVFMFFSMFLGYKWT